ncbi:dicarboxylate/amino acid:cation symporter [Agaribacter flavus]|uniref:Dicarboxylate/amino acid:cation symporter n=1 Tax=Agaribacter flavus TaxID=1902781 RepID=A0ABV7FMV4_9ALTE
MSETAKKSNLTLKIFIGMGAGIIIGAFLQILRNVFGNGSDDVSIPFFGMTFSIYGFFVEGIFNIGGTVFVKSLKMLVVPLVFVSLVCGVSSLSDPAKLGRLGGKSVALYLMTTAIAITVALVAALIVQPGAGFSATEQATFAAKESPGFANVIINMFPSNPIDSMAEGNMLQIIVFSILVGIAISLSGESGRKVRSGFDMLNDVIMKIVTIIMNLAPYGVFFLIAKLASTIELRDFGNIFLYFILVFVVLIVHAAVTYPLLLTLFARLNPKNLLIKMKDTAMFAFSSSSSNATLPITLATANKRLGVDNSVASFTVPLGATINMDGTAIMQGVATVFIAQVYGIDLTMPQILTVVATATLASIGTAGVPGVGLIMLAMVLQQVNLPVEGIALIIGIDRLLDMTRTVVNVTGDCTVTCIVAKSEGALDETVYNDMDSEIEVVPNGEPSAMANKTA